MFIHPDTVMLIISLIIGIVLFKGFKVKMREIDSTKQLIDGIVLFLLPPFILSDTVSLPGQPIIGNLKVNSIFGFLSSMASIFTTYLGLSFAQENKILDLGNITNQHLLAISFVMNLSSDLGFKLCAYKLADKRLSRVIQERYIINLIIVTAAVYMLRPDSKQECDRAFGCLLNIACGSMIALILGFLMGTVLSLMQSRIESLSHAPMLNILFLIAFSFLTNFIGQIDSQYLNEEVLAIGFGMMISGFAKYNLGPTAARRLIFILELFSKIAKIGSLAILGLILPESMFNLQSLVIVPKFYLIIIPVTIIAQMLIFFACQFAKVKGMSYGLKQFMMFYSTGMSKGPMAFILARKYLTDNKQAADIVDLAVATSILIFDPVAYFLTNLFEQAESVDNVAAKTVNDQLEEEDTKTIPSRVVAYITERIMSPVLIFDYHRRQHDGEIDDIRRVEQLVQHRTEVYPGKNLQSSH